MAIESLTYLSIALCAIALLYGCVGHAGASGYIAVMTLFNLAPADIKPIALVLNIAVASIASWQFWRAGFFKWDLFYPFAILAIPMAYIGGQSSIPSHVFKILLGIALLCSALHFAMPQKSVVDTDVVEPKKPVALVTGAVLGLFAGITGTGGGIFLTPILLLKRWAHTKNAAAVSALFILCNSIAGLWGNVQSTEHLPPFIGQLLLTVLIGGAIGSYMGSQKLNPIFIQRLLALVLLIAGLKLLWS